MSKQPLQLNRRDFGHGVLSSLLTYSVLETLCTNDVLADEIKPVTAAWLRDLHEIGLDLKGEELTEAMWKTKVDDLLEKASLPDLMKFIDLPKLKKVVNFRDRGEKSLRPFFPQVKGLPSKLVFGHQVFALKKDASVVPHGHNNMATAFLVMEGEFHGRHYDRLEDTETHMIIRPTIDDQFKPGGHSTVTDSKDNVHWFKCTSDLGYIFNIHVLSIKPGRSGRVYIDPTTEADDEGKISAKKLSTRDAYAKFG